MTTPKTMSAAGIDYRTSFVVTCVSPPEAEIVARRFESFVTDVRHPRDSMLSVVERDGSELTIDCQGMENVGPLLGFLTSLKEKIGYIRSPTFCGSSDDVLAQLRTLRREHDVLQDNHRGLQETYDAFSRDYSALSDRYETIQGSVSGLKTERDALTVRTESLSVEVGSLQSRLEEMRSACAVAQGIAESLEERLALAEDPFASEWIHVQELNERLRQVYALVGGRTIATLYQDASIPEEQYVVAQLGQEEKELVECLGGIDALHTRAVVEFSDTEWYRAHEESRQDALEAIEQYAQLSRHIEVDGTGIRITSRDGLRSMGVAIMTASAVYRAAKQSATDAQQILEEFRANEQAHGRIRLASEAVSAIQAQYQAIIGLREKIAQTVGQDVTVPIHLSLVGQTDTKYVFRGLLPVRKDVAETSFYRSLEFCLLSAALDPKRFPQIQFAQDSSDYYAYRFSVAKEQARTPRDVALLLYDIGDAMTTLQSQLDFGRVGMRLGVQMHYVAGDLPLVEDIVPRPAATVEPALEDVVDLNPRSIDCGIVGRPIVRTREELYRAFEVLHAEEPQRRITKALVLERFDVQDTGLRDSCAQYIANRTMGNAPQSVGAGMTLRLASNIASTQQQGVVMDYETCLQYQDGRAADVGIVLGSVDDYGICTRGVAVDSVHRTHVGVREILLAIAERGVVRSKDIAPGVKEQLRNHLGIPIPQDAREKSNYASRVFGWFAKLVGSDCLSTIAPFSIPNNCYMYCDKALITPDIVDDAHRHSLFFFGSDKPHGFHVAHRAVQYQKSGITIEPLLTFADASDRRTTTLDHYVLLGLLDSSEGPVQHALLDRVRQQLPLVQENDLFGSTDRLRDATECNAYLRSLIGGKLRCCA